MGPPQRCANPRPDVTIKVWPSGCVCQAVRAPGSNVTLAPRTRAGSGASNNGLIRTLPVNQSAGPSVETSKPLLLIFMYEPLQDGLRGPSCRAVALRVGGCPTVAIRLFLFPYLFLNFFFSFSAFQLSAFPRPRLLKRGEARRVHEIPVDMVHQCSMRLRFGLHFLPFRIGLESGPILLRLLTARMLQNVDKQVLRTRRIFGRPITNALHVVPPEDRVGVIAEARFQRIHLVRINVIHAQFVDVMRRLRGGSAECAEAEHQSNAAEKR